MATELVNLATSEKLTAEDWTKNIEICELVAQDQRQAKDVIKAIKKRLGNKHPNVQLYAVSLLEMLMNNIGEPIHKQLIDLGLLPLLVKLVKKKSDSPLRERIFHLLDATQTSVGGAKGKFPQYYDAYSELVSVGVQFPETQLTVSSDHTASTTRTGSSTSQEVGASNPERIVPQEQPLTEAAPGSSSIIQKARAALEVLREVLDAVDLQNPEAGKDEFTLDLVEQCSFQKQRVMHLLISSRDERLVSEAVELNEQLERLLARHDKLSDRRPPQTKPSSNIVHEIKRESAVSSSRIPSVSSHEEDEELEEEEEEQLMRRRTRKGKGKARVTHEDEEINRPAARGPLIIERALALQQKEPRKGTFSIPPPPAKHVEREKFFLERKGGGDSAAAMAALSLHSRSSSSTASID